MAAEYALCLGMCDMSLPRLPKNKDAPLSRDIHGDFEIPRRATFAAPICDSTMEARDS
jgi:hypothetical protein